MKSTSLPSSECVFCDKIERRDYDYRHNDSVIFTPLNPVVPGHRLIVPVRHLTDALDDPSATGRTMETAAIYAKQQRFHCNLVTSVGAHATQSVRHLHVHYVPRFSGDGLFLPWTDQEERQTYQEIRSRSYDQVREEIVSEMKAAKIISESTSFQR